MIENMIFVKGVMAGTESTMLCLLERLGSVQKVGAKREGDSRRVEKSRRASESGLSVILRGDGQSFFFVSLTKK